MSDRAALICSFWDESAKLAGLAWELGGDGGGLLWRDGDLVAATATIADRGDAVGLRLETGGEACEAELTVLPGEFEPAANGSGAEAVAAPCAVTVSVGAGNGRTARGSGELTRWRRSPTEGGGLLRHIALPAPEGALLVVVASAASGVPHSEERTSAWLLGPEGGASPCREALLSTQYDDSGLQSRAGLELWGEDEEAPPMRAAGTTLGKVPGDDQRGVAAALLRSSAEGLEAVGSYLIWRG